MGGLAPELLVAKPVSIEQILGLTKLKSAKGPAMTDSAVSVLSEQPSILVTTRVAVKVLSLRKEVLI